MDFEETILGCLSESLTGNISINKLSKLIKEKGLSGDYKNTYQKIIKLENLGFITTKLIGKSRILSINYANPQTISRLAMLELSKKIDFLNNSPNFAKIALDLDKIESQFIAIIEPQKNLSLNRIELLILTKDPEKEIKKCRETENKFSIKIDCLALNEKKLYNLIENNNTIITTMLSNKIILLGQENFFTATGKLINTTNLSLKEYSLIDLKENEIRHNLIGYGYSEFGTEDNSKELSIEETIISALLNGTARQIAAIKTILQKNDFNPELLFFLAKKYSKQKELLKLTEKIDARKNSNISIVKKLLVLAGETTW